METFDNLADVSVPSPGNSGKNVLIVLSGGQDSVTILGHALSKLHNVRAISFAYGQRHSVELECAARVCEIYGIDHKVVDIDFFGQLVDSALTHPEQDVAAAHPANDKLPASFVPNRNMLLLTLAHAHAQTINADEVWTGVCQTDYSGYPDCREEFIVALNNALRVGYQVNIPIVTPLMFLNKAETWEMAYQCGFINTVRHHSHTCYNGNHETMNDWGYGCGNCPACKLRANGYYDWLAGSVESFPEESPKL